MGIDNLYLFIAAGLLLNLTPGPDVLYIVANGLRGGAGHHGRLLCAHCGCSHWRERADCDACHGIHRAQVAGRGVFALCRRDYALAG